ncbi:hypothetical protein R6Q59_006841 [Mikania micrantha]|uniref:DUF4228 domain-containing protein n=1 Tax=Mikania micrantha TaxID=192012 RepID=A0A5N6PUA5_9ASTR|nr:hypothetical protein E3N88_03686 [Mikania micrantha]
MKFMSSLQCLMGGNVVQFQDSSSHVSQLSPADNDDHKRNVTKKKKKTKKKKDRKVIKVFKPDGEINLYHKPVKVSEVMTEEYMVCRSDSFYIGQKIPPLAQNDRLQPGHTYFLLPAHLFHSVLSFVTIASFTAASSSFKENQDMGINAADANMKMKAAFLKKAAASSCSPFDIQKTPSGTLRIRVSELFISQLMTDQAAAAASSSELIDLKASADHLLCTTPQLHREYKQLVVGSRRGWKPKLEIIKETPPKAKRKVKMLLSASINRMKRKMKNHPQISASSLKKRRKKIKAKKQLTVSASLKSSKFSKIL